jgi:two-component system, chemotaxis family, protein-glutamate methylesterase/glutaminase
MDEKRRLVVIGTSAGGLGALKECVQYLPPDFPAPILVVIHIGAHDSKVAQLLAPYSTLPIRQAKDNDPVEAGTILIAPPDRHLLVEIQRVRLSRGPKENFARPAIDPLFRSAAIAYRRNAIGVLLTGNLHDGTVGLQAIKAYGGTAIVQDPQEAEVPGMPLSALEHGDIDYCLPLKGIVEVLVELVNKPVESTLEVAPPNWIPVEQLFVLPGEAGMNELEKIAKPSVFTCPECHGSLWEIKSVKPRHFRCNTGHAFSASALGLGQDEMLEEAIWAAVRALHEKEVLLKQSAKSASESNREDAAAEHKAAAEQAARYAKLLRKMMAR